MGNCATLVLRRRKYVMLHRKPPKPPFYVTAPKGTCRYCGDTLLDKNGKVRTRASWHEDCLEEYKTIYWPGHTRDVIWIRDRGQCAKCPTKFNSKRGEWEVDHIRPLIEANGNIEFWKTPNLMTLCGDCHKKKTAGEATARAAARRADKPL